MENFFLILYAFRNLEQKSESNFVYATPRILLQGMKEVSGANVLLLNKYEGKLQFRNNLHIIKQYYLTG